MIGPVPVTKQALRARFRAERAALAERGSILGADEAARLLAVATDAGLLSPSGLPGKVGPVTIAAYIASPGEPDVGAVCAAVRSAGGRVLLPIPAPGRVLKWAWDDGNYAWFDRFPVQVPVGVPVGSGGAGLIGAGVQLLLAPATAVDRTGHRLGQGGGFYDRVLGELASLAAPIRVLAVVRASEVLPAGEIPHEAHDARVPGTLTPSGVVMLGS